MLRWLKAGLCLPLLFVAQACRANTVFDWQGTCTLGCIGTATGVLTLTSGDPLNFNIAQFVSFGYTSPSGAFLLDNSSPFLNAQGFGSSLLLEENAFGPNTLPLWQFNFNTAAIPTLTLSPDAGEWQFLSGSYFYQCLDASCTTWTDDVIRNVGVGGTFTLVDPAPIPTPTPVPSAIYLFIAGLGCFRLLRNRL